MNMRFGPEEAIYSTLDYAYMLRALQYGEISTLKSEPANHIMAIRNGKVSDNIIRSYPYETIELSKVAITYLIGDVIKIYSVLVDDKFQVTHSMVVKMLLTYGEVTVLCENIDKVIDRVGDFASEMQDEELLIQTATAAGLASKCYQVLRIAYRLLSIYQVVNHMLVDDAGGQEDEGLDPKDTL